MKILANDGISTLGIQILEEHGLEVITSKVPQEELIDYINKEEIRCLLVRSATKVRKDIIDACPKLDIIGRGGVGMDNIDVEYAKSQGRWVINTPMASSSSVAELVFAHLLSMVRSLHDSNRNFPLEGEKNFKALKKRYSKGVELKGKTLGLIGMGMIGQEVAKRAISLGMKVLFTTKSMKPITLSFDIMGVKDIKLDLKPVTKDTLMQESDFISLHIPSQDQPFIGKQELSLMKDGVGIINTSRGTAIEEDALIEALDMGKVAYAGLDVFLNEPSPNIDLITHPKVSITPHIGGSTVEAQARIGKELADQIIYLLTAEAV